MIKPGHIIFVKIDHEIIAGLSGSSRLTADLGVTSSNPQPALIMIEPGHIIFVEIDHEIIAGFSGSSRMRIWLDIRSLVGSLPGPATFFCGDQSWNIFYFYSLLCTDSKRAFVNFWQKNVHKYWLTAYRTKPVQEKVWLGKLTTLDMTPMDWLGRKTSTQTNKLWNNFYSHSAFSADSRKAVVNYWQKYVHK